MSAKKTRRKGVLKQFPRGRVCKKHGCKQALNVYNSGTYCHLHLTESLA